LPVFEPLQIALSQTYFYLDPREKKEEKEGRRRGRKGRGKKEESEIIPDFAVDKTKRHMLKKRFW
jgi:hypothetical protein